MPDARLADARLGAHSNDARYQTRRCQTWHALPGPFFRPSPPAVYLPLFLGYWLFHIENVQGQTPDKLLTSIFSHYPYGAGSKLRFDLLVIRLVQGEMIHACTTTHPRAPLFSEEKGRTQVIV